MIDLRSPLSFRNSFAFPLQTALSRREVVIGGLWLLVPFVGWIFNMGHRIVMVNNMMNGKPAWAAWGNYKALFRHGLYTFLGMVEYHAPSMLCAYTANYYQQSYLYIVAAILWVLATIAVPGYMSHYCRNFDSNEIFNPLRALQRVRQGGAMYWKAWSIALTAMLLSFLGLLLGGIGFLFTSVWFWQVAGFSFATVFTQKFKLKTQ